MLGSVAAMNASLDNDYGSARGSNAPDNLELALFVSDPDAGGLEMTSTGGYARSGPVASATAFPTAASGGAKTSIGWDFGTSSAAWDDVAGFFVIFDADSGDAWDSGPLPVPVSVNGSGVAVSVPGVTVYYGQNG